MVLHAINDSKELKKMPRIFSINTLLSGTYLLPFGTPHAHKGAYGCYV